MNLVPIADITTGGWVSSGASLYEVLDETDASDADYVNLPTSAMPDTMEVKFSSTTDPKISSGHSVKYRIKGTGTIVATLLCGATSIASWTHTPASSGWTTFSQSLTSDQTDAITDYADLRVSFAGSV